MWKLAPGLALMLAGCWQVAVVGDQLTNGGSSTTGGRSTSSGTGTGGHHTSGTSTGRTTSGTSTGKSDACDSCAPGATCDAGVCTCPGATDGTTCSYESTTIQEAEGYFCIEGTCALCVANGGGSLHGDQCLIPLALNHNSPECIAVDDTSVYWTDAQGVWKVPIRDVRKNIAATDPRFLPQLLYGAPNPAPVCLAVDAYYVYFTVIDNTVREVPLDGGDAIILASLQGEPNAIAVDNENIYWTNYSGNQVVRLMKTAAPVTPVVIADVVDGGNPLGIWVNSSNVFWTNDTDGEVLMAPLDGGDPTIIASGQGEPYGIVVNDSGGVYWTDNGTGYVVDQSLSEPLGGNTPPLVSDALGPTGIAVDSDFIYWTNYACSSNCVLKVPLDGGPVESVFPGESQLTKQAYRVAVDSENLYWTIYVPLQGSVYELTPK